MAVVVKIRNCHPHTVVLDPMQSRFHGNINKLSFAQIAIQRILKRLFASASRRLTTVQQKNIQPAVIIKIEQCNSSTHRFDEVTIGRKPVELPPRDASLGSYIRKYGLRTCIGSNQRS